jgi:hypothetical protein
VRYISKISTGLFRIPKKRAFRKSFGLFQVGQWLTDAVNEWWRLSVFNCRTVSCGVTGTDVLITRFSSLGRIVGYSEVSSLHRKVPGCP